MHVGDNMADLEDIIYKYTIFNASQHDGKANSGAIMGKIIAECPEVKNNTKDVMKQIMETVKKVEAISIDEQKRIIEEKYPELLERKKEELHELEEKDEEELLKELLEEEKEELQLELENEEELLEKLLEHELLENEDEQELELNELLQDDELKDELQEELLKLELDELKLLLHELDEKLLEELLVLEEVSSYQVK